MIRIAVAATLLALVALSTAAARAEDVPPASRTVSYVDLKLADPAGMKALRHRLFSAVIAVCGEAHLSDMDEMSDMLACRRQAMKRAEADTRSAIVQERIAARETGVTRVAAR